ncbi:MAG TPA: hypothetical protein VGR65_07465 [Casimicrobiaceae bacterium]|nr:hypothetical protein [Casimicrobiaceae bacterium]
MKNRKRSMESLARGVLSLLGAIMLLHAPAAFSQQRIEGKVVGTQLTHCAMDGKIGGCAGTLKLEHKTGDKTEELAFTVPLGTPITRGTEVVYLPALRGKTVVITQAVEKNERVAKAIELAK